MTANPLLNTSPWPAFSKIAPEHIGPAVEQAIAEHGERMAEIRAVIGPDFEKVFFAKERADTRLNWVWAPVAHLESVVSTPALRNACDAARSRLTTYRTSVAQD